MYSTAIRIFTNVVLIAMLPNSVLYASDNVDYKGQLSGEYVGIYNAHTTQNYLGLRYIPDLTLRKNLSPEKVWDGNISANTYTSYQSHSDENYDSSAKIYRLNTRYETAQSEIQVGLQHINFGPAVLLRSLRWFDQVSPTDPLKLTQGVKGIRYRYFMMNNANLWLWTLYGNSEPKGYERIASKDNTPEVGARYQFPLSSGEMGLSFHVRKTEKMGFTGDFVGRDLVEKRFALDGKWDIGPGVWFEYVTINQGAAERDNNWLSMLSLGSDYTFDYGNGIYTLLEHMISAQSENVTGWDDQVQTSAFQMSYPVNILDAVSLLVFYSWQQQQVFQYARWSRTYDNWAINLSVFLSSREDYPVAGATATGMLGDGVQLMIIYNH